MLARSSRYLAHSAFSSNSSCSQLTHNMMIAASMTEDTAAADGSAVQEDVPTRAKLTLEQKRQLVMTWFTQEELGRVKDLGPGKNFVRRAAKDLKLFQLRKLRAASSSSEVQRTNIDDMARRRVMSYRPRKFAAAAAEEEIAATATITTNLDPARVRSVLLAFYGSTGHDAAPLGRHLRNCGVLDHKAEILAVVRSINFRRMKRDGVSVEEATARLDEVLAAISFGKEQQEDVVAGCADPLYAMQIDGDAAKDATLAAPLISGKAQHQATRIAERRVQRQAMVKAKRAARLLRQQQKQSARQAAQKQQPDKALAILQSNPPLLKLVQTDEAQDLLMEWYSDPSNLSIVDFLRSKEEAWGNDHTSSSASPSLLDTYKRPLRLLVKAAQLHRLRKAAAGRDNLVNAVEDVLARASTKAVGVGVVAKKATVAKVTLKKNPSAAATLAGVTPEHLQHHLMQWFRDDKMPSVVDYLAVNEIPPDVRPAMAHVIKQLGLRQLRKERHLATVQARRRIKGALLGKGGQSKKMKPIKAKGKGGEDTAPTVSAVLPSAPPAKLLEEDYVSVSKEGGETTAVVSPSYDETVTTEGGKDDLDFVVIH